MRSIFYFSVLGITVASSITGHSDSPSGSIAAQPVIAGALPGALYKIGASTEDIGILGVSKTPPEGLLKAMRTYAADSQNKRYDSLSLSERDALVFFAYKLQAKGKLSDSALASLMTEEKLRTGMPKAHIKELQSLVETIRVNPNYELTFQNVSLIELTATFVNIDPYAFVDVLGTLIGPVSEAKTENVTITPETETILINAAKTVTGLNREQLDTLQDIGESYEETGQITGSSQDINSINQVLETSYYPDGANLLLPFLGAGTLIALGNAAYSYPVAFEGDTIYRYNREVVRNPRVGAYARDDIAPRYNRNWADNRARARAGRAGPRR